MCTSSLTIYLFSLYCYLHENESHWHMWPCWSMFNLRNVQHSDSHHDLLPLLLLLHLSTATNWTLLAQSETMSFLRFGLPHCPQISNMTLAMAPCPMELTNGLWGDRWNAYDKCYARIMRFVHTPSQVLLTYIYFIASTPHQITLPQHCLTHNNNNLPN